MVKVEIDRFDIEATLGSGGMGTVYRALDRDTGEVRALKLLRPEVLEERGLRPRFLREARAASALDHPSIARVFDVGELRLDSDTLLSLGLMPRTGIDRVRLPFISMELVTGTGLDLEIEEGFEVDEVLDLMAQILDALEAAHAIGVVHRDLKPENVLVTPEGRAKLLDFGLAKILPGAEADLGSGSQLTLDGMVMGTLPYLAPEQLQAASTRRRSDIFSLGVLVYEMLTGSTPFPGSSMVEYARAILTRNAEPPSLQRSEVPPWLDILVLSMLQIEPEDRPTATEVRRTLFSHFVPPAKARRAEPREPLPAGDGTCRGGPPAEPLDGEAPSRKVHSRKVQSGKATGDGYGEDDGNDRAPDAGLGPERAIGTEAESWYRPPSGWVVAALLILALVLLYLLG